MSLERTRTWLGFARKTLKSAERDLGAGDYNWACFKAQQAAVAALKTVLTLIGQIGQHRFTHSTLALIKIPGILRDSG